MAKVKVKFKKVPEQVQSMYIGSIVSKNFKDEALKELFLENMEAELGGIFNTQSEVDLMMTVIKISTDYPKVALPIIVPSEKHFDDLIELMDSVKMETLECWED